MRPLIGLSTGYDLEESTYVLREYYVESIIKAGGLPLILPAVQQQDIIQSYSSICDALVLTGGGDADPALWGEWPHKDLGQVNPIRDYFELQLTCNMLKMGKAILGICRGCQIINLAAGGSLVQNLEGSFMHEQKAPRNYAFHPVFIEKYTKLERILRSEEIKVNSFHHQAIKVPGPGMVISACAPDGTIEAIEYAGQEHLVIGIQWHPECLEDLYAGYLFQALVEAAAKKRS
jgi:putative glutamine amidotransferase